MVNSSYNDKRRELVDKLCKRYEDNSWSDTARYLMFKSLARRIANGLGIRSDEDLDKFSTYVRDRLRAVNPIAYRSYVLMSQSDARQRTAEILRAKYTPSAKPRRRSGDAPPMIIESPDVGGFVSAGVARRTYLDDRVD